MPLKPQIQNLIKDILITDNVKLFIETGTYVGKTTKWAMSYFSKVYTIEKSEKYYNNTKNLINSDNVQFIHGDSGKELSNILSAINEPVIFWLDAHWSGADTAGEDFECPVLEEIVSINKWAGNGIILIDDARLFLSTPYAPHNPDHWPTITDLVYKLNDNIERYVVIIHDIIVAVPIKYKNKIINFCQDENSLIWQKQLAYNDTSHIKKALYHIKEQMKKFLNN